MSATTEKQRSEVGRARGRGVARPDRPPVGDPDWSLEQGLWARGLKAVAGVDEAGRGALAGPVVAAVVLLEAGREQSGGHCTYSHYPYRDSKTLTRARRAELAERIRGEAVAFAVGHATAVEIDALNILGATKLAARRAVAQLGSRLDGLVTDYLELTCGLPEVAVARADARSFQVAAASIIAKHERDELLAELAGRYPGYGFAGHVGYGVPRHLAALRELGPCPEHRRSFAPVAAAALFGTGGQGA